MKYGPVEYSSVLKLRGRKWSELQGTLLILKSKLANSIYNMLSTGGKEKKRILIYFVNMIILVI